VSVDRRAVIEDISFGGRTAEDESDHLARYFVETEQWRKVWSDEVDIVFAPKGGGKSAIYSMLVSREEALFSRNVILVPGENPTGATAFASIQTAPPTTETEFVRIWQLYFLVLVVEELERYGVTSEKLKTVRRALGSIGLTDAIKVRRTIVTRVRDVITRWFNPESIETSMTVVDPSTGSPIDFGAKITFDEPDAAQSAAGVVSVDQLYEDVNEVLEGQVFKVWLMLDRLDVAFTASPELEANALRALFRVYKLLEPLKNIRMKIFLRTDIWAEITAGGFRETSHITRDMTLQWSKANLLQLITQRLIQSSKLAAALGVDPDVAVGTAVAQQELFHRVFPKQVDAGTRKPATFDWCMSRTEDGKSTAAPRELIHLFTVVRDRQLGRFDTGEASLPDDLYFEAQSFREAHPEVSETRLQKTIYPEYPWLRDWLEALRGQRTLHDLASLQALWACERSVAEERVRRLVDVGFFESLGPVANRTYKVPFLYRPALEMIQGAAEGVKARSGDDDEEALFDDAAEVEALPDAGV